MRRRKQQFLGLAAFAAFVLLFRGLNNGGQFFGGRHPKDETAKLFDPLHGKSSVTVPITESIPLHDVEPISHPNVETDRVHLPHPGSSQLVESVPERRRKTTLAIATTILRPGPSFSIWLDYHLQHDTDLIIVFMDDPAERSSIDRIVQGRPVVLLDGSKVASDMTPESRLILRQDENNNAAIAYALSRNITWLMHIDIDELLYEDGDQSWRDDEDAGEFSFVNHESVPLRHESRNYFADCHLFKVNGGELPFMAYGNGKSVVRLGPGVQGLGPHAFWGYQGVRKEVKKPMILHYANPSYESWLAKYRFYGDFPDYWFNNPDQPNSVSFMLQSRDQVRAAEATGNWDAARNFYYSMIPDEHDIEDLVRSGTLLRIDPFSESR